MMARWPTVDGRLKWLDVGCLQSGRIGNIHHSAIGIPNNELAIGNQQYAMVIGHE